MGAIGGAGGAVGAEQPPELVKREGEGERRAAEYTDGVVLME